MKLGPPWAEAYNKSWLTPLAHLKALRVSASTHRHLLCTPVRNATRDCSENPPTSTLPTHRPPLVLPVVGQIYTLTLYVALCVCAL